MKYTSRTTIGGRIRVSCFRSRQQQKLSVLSLASIALVELMILLGSTDIIVTTSPVVDAFRTSSYQSSSRSNIPSSSFLLTPRGTTTIVKTRATTNNLLLLFSSIGDGDGGGGSSGGGRGSDDDNDLGDFLDPMKKPDSEGMKRARQYMSETSLPISFGDDGIGEIKSEHNNDIDHEKDNDRNSGVVEENKYDDLMSTYNEDEDNNNNTAILNVTSSSSDTEDTDDSTELSSSSSLVSSRGNATSSALFGGGGAGGSDNNGDDDDNNKSQQQITGPSPSLLAKNPYMQVVSKISPSDLIAKFTAESDPRVQEAVRTTILGLIGSLPKLAFETTSITTGQRLASLVRTYARKNILDYLSILHTVVNIMELSIFLTHFCSFSCALFVYNI